MKPTKTRKFHFKGQIFQKLFFQTWKIIQWNFRKPCITNQSQTSYDQCGSYPGVLQVLNVRSIVTILHCSGQNPEAFASDGIDHGTTISEEVDAPDDQHAAIVCKPENVNTFHFSKAATTVLGAFNEHYMKLLTDV